MVLFNFDFKFGTSVYQVFYFYLVWAPNELIESFSFPIF